VKRCIARRCQYPFHIGRRFSGRSSFRYRPVRLEYHMGPIPRRGGVCYLWQSALLTSLAGARFAARNKAVVESSPCSSHELLSGTIRRVPTSAGCCLPCGVVTDSQEAQATSKSLFSDRLCCCRESCPERRPDVKRQIARPCFSRFTTASRQTFVARVVSASARPPGRASQRRPERKQEPYGLSSHRKHYGGTADRRTCGPGLAGWPTPIRSAQGTEP
jgi:hypothetical protein